MEKKGYIKQVSNELLIEMLESNIWRLAELKQKGLEFTVEFRSCQGLVADLQKEAKVRGIKRPEINI